MKDITSFYNQLHTRGFLVKPQEDGAYTLVHPSRGKYNWEPDELCYRSVVFDAARNVVSSGWPKFFNQGEWPDADSIIARELENGTAVITHKHDGSLLIRSVLPDGRVLFRTRDTFDGGKFATLAEAVAREKYSILLDPTFHTHGSLLFEYVGAENQIVVRYNGSDDLILLGVAFHVGNSVRYATYSEVVALAKSVSLRVVETYDWSVETYDWSNAKSGISQVLEMVRDWNSAEGVVVRSSDGQTLLKIKSAWYFAQHALRWQVRLPTIARFCIDAGIVDEPMFLQKLTEIGWDYETATVARGYFQTYLERRTEAEDIKEKCLAFLAAFDAETKNAFADERARRKAFAGRIFGPNTDQKIRNMSVFLFYIYDGKVAHMEAKLLQKLIFGNE